MKNYSTFRSMYHLVEPVPTAPRRYTCVVARPLLQSKYAQTTFGRRHCVFGNSYPAIQQVLMPRRVKGLMLYEASESQTSYIMLSKIN